MTTHSLVPKAAAVAGMDYAELCWRVLETSFDREQGAGSREQGTAGVSSSDARFPTPDSRGSEGDAT